MDNVTRHFDGQQIMPLAYEEIKEPALSNNGHGGSQHAVSGSSLDAAKTPVIFDEITGKLEEDKSQNTIAFVRSDQTAQRRISIFQGIVERVRRTVRGSADDIGWLQSAPEMPPVEDGTERFTTILEIIRNDVHMLPNSMVYLLVPGLFSNHGPLYFTSTKTSFLKMGLTCHIAKIHSEMEQYVRLHHRLYVLVAPMATETEVATPESRNSIMAFCDNGVSDI